MESYGLVGFYTLIVTFAGLLDFGLSTTLNRELAKLSGDSTNLQKVKNIIRTFEMAFWGVGLVFGLIVCLCASSIVEYWLNAVNLSSETLELSIFAIGISLACQWPSCLYSGGLMGMQRQVLNNVILISFGFLRSAGAFLVIKYVSPSILTFFVFQIVISFIQTLVLAMAVWKSVPGATRGAQFKMKIFKEHWRFAAGMTVITLQAILVTNLDKILISKMVSLEEFGYYSLASMIAGSLYFIISPMFNVFFPRFTEIINKKSNESLSKIYHSACQLISLLIFPVGITLALFSKEFIYLWTNDEVVSNNTSLIVTFLCLGTICNGLVNLPYALQLAYGKTKFTLYFNFALIFFELPLFYYLVPLFGPEGGAFCWFIANAFYLLVSAHCIPIKFMQQEKWRWYFYDIFLPLIGVVPLAILYYFFSFSGLNNVERALFLFSYFLLALVSVAILTPLSRNWLLNYLFKKRVVEEQLP
jgi:O-antigen/teichoic acid export membrane protein